MSELNHQKSDISIPREVVADGFVLRLFEGVDPQEFLDLVQDPDIQKFIPWAPEVTDLTTAQQRIAMPVSSSYIRYGIYQDNKLAGFIGAWSESDPHTYQTGSALSKDYRGHGLTNRAFQAMLPTLKELGAQKISCYVSEENEASKANVAKRGLHPTEQFNDKDECRWEMDLMNDSIEHQDENMMLREFVVDDRTVLRPITVEDSEQIFEILEADGDIRDHVGLFGDCDTLEYLKEKLADQIAHGSLRYAITLDNELVGYIGIHQDPDEKRLTQYNISDFLSSKVRGQGIMTKALKALLEEAESNLHIDRWSGWVEEGNPASAKVLESLGFTNTNIPYKDGKDRTNWDYIREVTYE